MLYQAYQLQSDLMSPLRLLAQGSSAALWLGKTEGSLLRKFSASMEVFSRLRLTHSRPAYGITSVKVGERDFAVTEEAVLTMPFGTLLRFKKENVSDLPYQPPVLLVAPLSGHFATLLRETVRTLLQDHDVYITDWHNARDVSLRHGPFALDDYIDHMIRFTQAIGPAPTWWRCASPAWPRWPHRPDGRRRRPGPAAQPDADGRPGRLPREPDRRQHLATSKPIEWFEKNLISHVPLPHAGYMRRVYPGFVQLSAFLSMNLDRHKQQFQTCTSTCSTAMWKRPTSSACSTTSTWPSTTCPPSSTWRRWKRSSRPTTCRWANSLTAAASSNPPPSAAPLMTVEGERDDICAVGQTVAAQDLCTGIRPYMKTHHVQTGVGHYGVFSGRKWNQQIYPRVREMIHASMG
jgi:poly(3-hydroxybutyrate) depolymerase